MADLRPGLASYSRAAYMRELHGDLSAATELMSLAVRAGSPRDPEPLAWCLAQLGNLHFNQGNLPAAEEAYQEALTVLPHYYVALSALARVRGAQSRTAEAIALYEQAVAIVPAPDSVAALGDLLAYSNKPDKAEQQYALVEHIARVNALNRVTYARQLALFYVDHDRHLADAIRLAETELARRQDIYSYDTVAWVYYKAGRFAEAQTAIRRALRLGTQDALLFFHAGMIAHAAGEHRQAGDFLRRALSLNPYFSVLDADHARLTLAKVEQHLADTSNAGE
jgi:tetratricopeptide (TPR) repeat protein